jgi:hypothetical protein
MERPTKRARGAAVTVAKALIRPEYNKYVGMETEGLQSIADIKDERHKAPRSYEPPKRIVGSFGIVESNGFKHTINWKISGARRDKRHGPVEPAEPVSKYGKHLMESLFKGW